jgi:hypothetical protein
MYTQLFSVLAAAGLAQAQVAHMMRFACSQLTVERLDPLVNPGLMGSPHTHQIVGGNSFQPEMNPGEYDMVGNSTCTSCTFSEGRSLLVIFLIRCSQYVLETDENEIG